MTDKELINKLNELRKLHAENEIVEFKEARNGYDFKTMITEYLKKSGPTKRGAIDNLIIPKLSAVLTDEQKRNKVTNYLSTLRREGIIVAKPGYFWELV